MARLEAPAVRSRISEIRGELALADDHVMGHRPTATNLNECREHLRGAKERLQLLIVELNETLAP